MLQFFPEPRPDEARVRALTRSLVAEHIRPHAIEDDESCFFRRTAFEAVAAQKLHCLTHDPKFGGGGESHRCFFAFLEELARGSLSLSVGIGVTNLVQSALAGFGTDSQKARMLPKLTSGEWLGAFALSEPQAGSDAASLRLAARRVKGGYELNGTKCWCSNAGQAEVYLVMARTGEHRTRGISSFLVPKTSKGFRVGKLEKKLGLRASTLAELIFEECFIPDEQRLAGEGDGFTVALSGLDAGRISIGSAGIGGAIEALERAWRHLDTRLPVHAEGTRQFLAEHYAHIQAVRALVGEAAQRRDTGQPITALASTIKLLASDRAVAVAQDAVHLMAEAGARRENEVERILRDAKALQIVEGTNQIQRLVLSRELDRMLGTNQYARR